MLLRHYLRFAEREKDVVRTKIYRVSRCQDALKRLDFAVGEHAAV